MRRVAELSTFGDPMSALKKLAAAIGVFVVVFALTFFLYFPYSPLGRQQTNLRLAEEHRPKAEEGLRRIPGADRVRAATYTGLGGSLSISGDVKDEQTAERVISTILSSGPPVTVRFDLMVGETGIVRKTVEPPSRANSHSSSR